MHNCNVSPEHMMKFCPLVPERYREHPYLYNADNPLHQRAAMVLELLHGNTRVTVDQARAIALSPQVYGAERWQARLVQAWKKAGGKAELRPLYESIVRWNRLADADSTGAVAYLFWKKHLGSRVLRADRAGQPPVEVSDEQVLKALAEGAQELEAQYGKKPVCWGDIFRVGREGSRRTWPVAGGSVPGLATPRAIGFRPQADGRTYLGRSGQTAVILVQLSNPPRSWTLLPLGNSDRPASPHFDDQAEKLFSKGKMKPTYFLDKARLLENVESRRTLIRPTTR
jgi:acyl-homoserine-lactone acylase